jgi:acetyl-CoA carboxylase biotin carboxyl carrier protein
MSTPKPTPKAPKAPESAVKLPYLGELDALAAWLEGTSLAEVEIEHNGLKIKLKKPSVGQTLVAAAPVAAVAPQAAAKAAAEDTSANTFTSPLVGTFYEASSPDAPAFVSVGTAVKEGQVLGIVEAMKTMNQLTSDRSGTVQKILVKNGSPVEFGQPLFVIA